MPRIERSEQSGASEQVSGMSKQMSEWPITNIPISRGSESLCLRDNQSRSCFRHLSSYSQLISANAFGTIYLELESLLAPRTEVGTLHLTLVKAAGLPGLPGVTITQVSQLHQLNQNNLSCIESSQVLSIK